MVLQTENYLRGIQPNVRVTVNEYCSKASTYNVTVSFGLREKGSNDNCDLQESQSATLAPDVAMTFYVNKTTVMLSDGYEYCFSFQKPSCEFNIVSVTQLHILCASIAMLFPSFCIPIVVEADFTSINNALVFLNNSTATLFHKFTLST